MPTIKQKKAAKKVVGNGGNITKAMREVGYSENTLNTPGKLTDSKGWSELMEKHISDDKLAKVHDEGLKATKIHGTTDDYIEIPDYAVRHKYMDTGYKLKGKLIDKSINTNINIAEVLRVLNEQDE